MHKGMKALHLKLPLAQFFALNCHNKIFLVAHIRVSLGAAKKVYTIKRREGLQLFAQNFV